MIFYKPTLVDDVPERPVLTAVSLNSVHHIEWVMYESIVLVYTTLGLVMYITSGLVMYTTLGPMMYTTLELAMYTT